MGYSEFVKNFERIRDYMRQFYVYGFKSRSGYDAASARGYDNERRRIESWLGEYMSFRQDDAGKAVFLSVDSRSIKSNPLYAAFKAKSFTDGDIVFHFYIMDLLSGGEAYSIKELLALAEERYFSRFGTPVIWDESTVRKKLREYGELGLVKSEKRGRELTFAKREDAVDLESWREAVSFFSEADPLGVVGAYVLDRYARRPDHHSFKHHYILHALDSQVLCDILLAMGERRCAALHVRTKRGNGAGRVHTVCPYRIHISTQTGLVIRVLSFGPLVKAVSPGEFVEKVRERIEKQTELRT